MRLKDVTGQDLNITDNNVDMFELRREAGCRSDELMPIEEDGLGS